MVPSPWEALCTVANTECMVHTINQGKNINKDLGGKKLKRGKKNEGK